jgi:hypothetical protein
VQGDARDSDSTASELHAYAEAGHAVMSYLLKQGQATEFVPLSRSDMLPPFPGVKLTPHGAEWGRLTANLGSMMTTAQVVLAGWVVLNEKFEADKILDLKSPLVQGALYKMTAYAEEYVSDDDFEKRDRAAMNWLNEMHATVRKHIQASWSAVESLAQQLIRDPRDLSEAEAFAVIDAAIQQE